MKHILFFKFYFWLMALLIPMAVWLDITDEEPLIIIDFFDYLFWVVAIIGVFGYCYSKRILNAAFWKVFLPFIILWDICVIYYEIFSNPEILSDGYGLGFIVLLALFCLIIILPEYIAIYLYGYKTKNT